MFKIGADPEVFLEDAAGALKSAITRIGGSKHAPLALPNLGDGFAMQEDNVALEFNIPAADSPEQLKEHLTKIKEFLSRYINSQGLRFSKLSAASFPDEELNNPAAREFGCDPDFNAWRGGRRNPRPAAPDPNLRSAGGHVHVGHKLNSMREIVAGVKYMDMYLGVASTLMDQGELRKMLYGKAGCFRPKPYGFEYRTLSNYWIFDDKLIDWVWNNTALALDAMRKNNNKFVYIDDSNDIQTAINEYDKKLAAQLVKKFSIPVL